jgi:3-hydroxybutyryl-CoA dehydrogenase
MTLDVNRGDLTVGVAGCGVMGTGIAQVAAAAGCRVLLFDAREDAAARSCETLRTNYAKLVDRGKMSAADAAHAEALLRPVSALAEFASADIVIEAIIEDLGAKRRLMNELEEIVGGQCLIATNTSSLSVTEIASTCRKPGRIGGFHFFNPVPLMKIVEVIDGALTEPWVGEALEGLAKRLGHRPVRARDTPGFIVNHAGRGFGTEALRILDEGVADTVTIDRILKGAAGFRMGPFELLDLTGLDVSHPVMESIYHQYYEEPRFRPSPTTRRRLAAGLLGKKSQRGFYSYIDGKPESDILPPLPTERPLSFWVADGLSRDRVAAIAAAACRSAVGPEKADVIIVPLVGEDASTAVTRLRLDPRRSIGIDTVLGLDSHRTLVATPASDPAAQRAVLALFAADGVPASLVKDSPGGIAQRVVAMIVNIACDIAQQRIADPADIDAAVVLGLGYPRGPLAWGDEIGAATVLQILETLTALTHDPRYRPSPWLRRRAQLGLSLLHADL